MSHHQKLSALLTWEVDYVNPLDVSQLEVEFHLPCLKVHPFVSSCACEDLPYFSHTLSRRWVEYFIWYLYSFRHTPSGNVWFCDTFAHNKWVWQIIYSILQIYNPLNLKFGFFSMRILLLGVYGIPIYFWAFSVILEFPPNVRKCSSLKIQSAYRTVSKSPVRGSRCLMIDKDKYPT
jgi:hypothetical protein